MTRFFVRHPVTTWMIFVAFVLLGTYSLPRLEIEAIPEVELPTLSIRTVWNNASPVAVQRSITIPIEEAVRKVRGVQEVKSSSSFSHSLVEVSFRRGVDLEFARVELNEQLGSVRRTLPMNAGQPEILPYVPEEFRTEQFFAFSLESPLDPYELREVAENWVVPRLLAVDGVADATVMGGARPVIKIVLDRRKLDLYGLSADEIYAAIDRLDQFSGAGSIRSDGIEKLVAVRDSVTIAGLQRAVIARKGDRTFTLDMVGEVVRDHEDPAYYVRANARNVIQVSVEKRSGSNSIAVSRRIRNALPRIENEVPFELSFHVDEDQGKDLEEKLRELIYRSLAIIVLLALLLSISLRQLRLTVVITASIVFAVVISLSLFYFLGISVNFITISGLTICFGMILDNGILVLDSIHRRLAMIKRVSLDNFGEAARIQIASETIVRGTGEVLFPVVATTLTTMVAFGSFIFISGRLSLYYLPLAVAVATALGASLFVAFAWVPVVLHDWWAKSRIVTSGSPAGSGGDPVLIDGLLEARPDLERPPGGLERIFMHAQRLWFVVIPFTLALFLWGWHIYDTKVIKGGFWRMPDPEQLVVYMEMPSGTDIELTSRTFLMFEEALEPIPSGARVRSQVWGNQAFMRIEFSDSLLSTEVPMYYRTVLTDMADRIGGSSIYIAGFSETPYIRGSFGGSTLNSLVKITGYNSKELQEIAEAALRGITLDRRVRNARITTGDRYVRITGEEMLMRIDRDRAASSGLSVLELVRHIRRLLGMDIPWSMLIDGEQKLVQLAFSDADELQFSDAMETLINTATGEKVRLADLVMVERKPLTGKIVRENQRYTAFLNWEYIGTEAMRQAFLKKVLQGLDLPYGYDAEEARREFFTREEEEQLALTLFLALVFIFIVLAALFESISLPFLVLLSVPMALLGVFILFWLSRSSFDSSARIGLVLLFGIVVNNAILLTSRFRTEAAALTKRTAGRDSARDASLFPGARKHTGGIDMWELPREQAGALLREAAARATRIRLRSILLTSSTTIVGLVPLLVHFQRAEDKDIWENLALASIGGLASSTILLILSLPAFYYVSVRIGWLWRDLLLKARRGRTLGKKAGS